jgi:hypothetical protein
VKHLLYDEKYTISGAKKRLKVLRVPTEKQLALDFGVAAPPAPEEPETSEAEPPPAAAPVMSTPELAAPVVGAARPPRVPAELVRRMTQEIEALFELVREDEPVR